MSDKLPFFTKHLGKIHVSLQTLIGYPINLNYNYAELSPFFHLFLNNVGDPFSETKHHLSTHLFERKIINFLAKLLNLSKTDRWGYITNGGTEGNMYGIFMGRELYPDGILYFSQDTHYSITKIARILHMSYEIIPSLENGEIDYAQFEKRIRTQKNKPVIVCANYGTTMKGAIDNTDKIISLLEKNNIQKFYIHIDAALFGMILPFIKGAPHIDLSKQIGSVAISGYKFLGIPFPTGIVLTKKQFVKQIERKIEYVGALDTTISGSRNGHGPLLIWYAIQERDMKEEAKTCLLNAHYLNSCLEKLSYNSHLNPYSNIVWFKKPPQHVIQKWHLATQGDFAHIVVLQHVTKEKIDEFLKDINKKNKS